MSFPGKSFLMYGPIILTSRDYHRFVPRNDTADDVFARSPIPRRARESDLRAPESVTAFMRQTSQEQEYLPGRIGFAAPPQRAIPIAE